MSEDGELPENIRRLEILLAELGYLAEKHHSARGHHSLSFRRDDLDLQAAVVPTKRFAEFSAQLSFGKGFADFLAARVDDLQQVCYHYGCYQLVVVEADEIVLSVHTKLYFSGLQYYALKEALDDLAGAAKELRHLFEPATGPVGG